MIEPSPDSALSQTRPAYHPFRQLAIQGAAALAVLSLLWPYYGLVGQPYDWFLTSGLIGICASVFARFASQPWWWRIIHLLFAPLAWLVLQLDVDPGWFLLGFIGLFMVFRGAITGQIPLYLTANAAVDALGDLIEERHCQQVVDLGAGIGSAIVPLARSFPQTRFTGVEYSMLTFAIGWLRTRGMRNVDWRYADLWSTPLGPHDLVYAFLSPAPMESLGEKVDEEMNPTSLFVSNSFAIPQRVAIETRPAGARTLYCYTPGKTVTEVTFEDAVTQL